MIKNSIHCEYSVIRIPYHDKVKSHLLTLLDDAEFSSPHVPGAEVQISKTDWHLCTNTQRPWFQYFKDEFLDTLLSIYRNLGYGGFRLNEIWFQQYLTNSQHGWHTHGSNFTNVYYLELPKDSPKTELIEPFTKKRFYLDVEEGDLVTFPSFVLHRTEPNLSVNRKSIISFNVNSVYSDDIYGQGIE